MKRYTLHKGERLKRRTDIDTLFRTGRSFSHPPFRLYYSYAEGEGHQPLLFGVGVGKRHFKKAVDRNRIKRLVREAYRVRKEILQPVLGPRPLQVFFIFTGRELPSHAGVSDAVAAALLRLQRTLQAT